MSAPLPAGTLDFGASATASLLVKMTITYGMSERRDQMITYSLFEKLMRNGMPSDQRDLDAILLIEDKKENLHGGVPNQLSDDLKLCVRHQSDATKTRLSF